MVDIELQMPDGSVFKQYTLDHRPGKFVAIILKTGARDTPYEFDVRLEFERVDTNKIVYRLKQQPNVQIKRL